MATISRGTTPEKYQFINHYKDEFGVKRLCEHLNVSRSGYYDWSNREESTRAKSDRILQQHIHLIFYKSKGIYGSSRIHQALRKQGVLGGRKRVARLMKKAGLKARFARVYRYRTDTFESNFIVKNLRNDSNKPVTMDL